MKISILGIGTELTTGQINNKNAQNISIKMKELGIPTSVHVVVPDDRQLILKALDYCLNNCDLMFVTGGLGPTSDDFTRTVIAEYFGLDLFWHEESWLHVKNRLESRGIAVREIQKQQCFYPAGSKVLENRLGTANGFYLEAMGKQIFILPGPPKEIDAIWQDHINKILQSHVQDLDPIVTKSWDCLGIGESEVANIVEPLLNEFPGDISYRVHLPYVEFKLSFARKIFSQIEPFLVKVDQALEYFTAAKDGQDPLIILIENTRKFGFKNIIFDDQVSNGYLMNRWNSLGQDLKKNIQVQFVDGRLMNYQINDDSLLLMIASSKKDKHSLVSWKFINGKVVKTEGQMDISCPYSETLYQERASTYYAEKSLLTWNQAAFLPSNTSDS